MVDEPDGACGGTPVYQRGVGDDKGVPPPTPNYDDIYPYVGKPKNVTESYKLSIPGFRYNMNHLAQEMQKPWEYMDVCMTRKECI